MMQSGNTIAAQRNTIAAQRNTIAAQRNTIAAQRRYNYFQSPFSLIRFINSSTAFSSGILRFFILFCL